jgi:hypothetical protein
MTEARRRMLPMPAEVQTQMLAGQIPEGQGMGTNIPGRARSRDQLRSNPSRSPNSPSPSRRVLAPLPKRLVKRVNNLPKRAPLPVFLFLEANRRTTATFSPSSSSSTPVLQASRPRLVAKSTSGFRDSTPRNLAGNKAGSSAPDPSQVWNRNKREMPREFVHQHPAL